MKMIQLTGVRFHHLLSLAGLLFFFYSCQGEVKVVAHHNHIPDNSYSYFVAGGVKLELYKGGKLIGTQYGDGISTLDFGNFEYGKYKLTAIANEYKVSLWNGATSYNASINKSVDFEVKTPTTFVNVELP